MTTDQMKFWQGQFGKDYTDRNTLDLAEVDNGHVQRFGVSRTALNERFVGSLPRDTRILEVGCNVGQQLQVLQAMGFTSLTGVELQRYAVERSRERVRGIDIIQGSGFELPFRDGWFDVVMTNGVLIHISPENHATIMREVVRCSRRYIWGFEYYAEQLTEVNYRGHDGYLWKADFASIYQQHADGLHLVKQEMFAHLTAADAGNVDAMYLLEKTA